MIDEESFVREMDKTAKMLREAVTKEYILWMYRELGNIHEYDFYAAIKDILAKKLKITFDNLQTFSLQRKWERLDREAKERNRKEAREVREILASGKEPSCMRRHQCYDCPIQDCRIVGKATIKGMIDIANGTRTTEQVNTELAMEFPGAGYEQSVAENTF